VQFAIKFVDLWGLKYSYLATLLMLQVLVLVLPEVELQEHEQV
jgi:hypothetical protein